MLMFSDILTPNGSSFQMRGPMDEKLELCTILSLLIEIGNINKLPDLSDRDWLDCCMTSSCKYLGALPCTHYKHEDSNLVLYSLFYFQPMQFF